MNLEEEMARHKREESKVQNKQPKESGHGDQASQAGPSTSRSGSNTNGPTEKKKTKDQAAAGQENVSLKDKEPETKVAEDALESRAPTGASSTSKGKRKVTFDVQPAVVTIDAGKEQQDAARGDAGGMFIWVLDQTVYLITPSLQKWYFIWRMKMVTGLLRNNLVRCFLLSNNLLLYAHPKHDIIGNRIQPVYLLHSLVSDQPPFLALHKFDHLEVSKVQTPRVR